MSKRQNVYGWLSQFDVDSQADAISIVESIETVSYDQLFTGLRDLLIARKNSLKGNIGLYAERELPSRNGIPHRLFKESKTKIRRAFGVGPAPVSPTRVYKPEVGSEGLVAHLITELCRKYRNSFFNHPGPDAIRRHSIRHFIVLTDFIGTGQRAWKYLEAAWRVRSVRSWSSLGLMRFGVVAYSAASRGRKRVEGHPSAPFVDILRPCPTIDTEFSAETAQRLRELCIRYDPVDRDRTESLGHGGVGALIAFAHGMPNNAPRMLHKSRPQGRRPWQALFPARVTAGEKLVRSDPYEKEEIALRLNRMLQRRLAISPWLARADDQRKRVVLVLASLGRGPRNYEAIARKTGLTVLEIQQLTSVARTNGWIDSNMRLTDSAYSELKQLKSWKEKNENLEPDNPEVYYPIQLRAPRFSSS
jgi:hypothetical protein